MGMGWLFRRRRGLSVSAMVRSYDWAGTMTDPTTGKVVYLPFYPPLPMKRVNFVVIKGGKS